MNLFYKILKCGALAFIWLCCLVHPTLSQPSANLVHHFSFDNTLSNSTSTYTLSAFSYFGQDRFGNSSSAYKVESDMYAIYSVVNNLPAGATDRTVAFWVQIPDWEGEFQLFSHGTSGKSYYISYNTLSKIFIIGNGTYSVGFYTEIKHDWMHLAVTYNHASNAHKIYIDGVFLGDVTLDLSSSVSSPLRIGENSNGARGANFNIDELFIYDRTLSATEVFDLYSVKCLPNPVAVASKSSVCPGESVQISVNKVVYIFDATGKRVSINDKYTTQNLNASTTFYIIDSISGSCHSNRVPVSITVNEALPMPESATDYLEGNICGESGNATLKVKEKNDYTINWYESQTGGTAIATGPVFVTPTLSANKMYYVAYEAPGSCPSRRSSEWVWVYPKYELNFVANKTEICPGEIVEFSGFDAITHNIYKGDQIVSGGDIYGGGMPFSFKDTVFQTSTYVLEAGEWLGCMVKDTVIVSVQVLNPIITASGNVLSTEAYETYQWYKNDQIIEGATLQTLEVQEEGSYKVFVTNENGCSGMSNGENVAITSLNGRGVSKVTNLYPNPASSLLHVELKEAGQIRILSMLGEQLGSINVSDGLHMIDVSHLKSGVYMLQTDKGESIRFTKN